MKTIRGREVYAGLMLLFAALLAGALARSTAAAKCAPPGRPRAELARHHLVFVGTVTALADSLGRNGRALRHVQVHVRSIWKGEPMRTFSLTTAGGGREDAVPLALGETYVVYADSVDGVPWIPACGRTAPLSRAGVDVAELGDPTPIVPLSRRHDTPR